MLGDCWVGGRGFEGLVGMWWGLVVATGTYVPMLLMWLSARLRELANGFFFLFFFCGDSLFDWRWSSVTPKLGKEARGRRNMEDSRSNVLGHPDQMRICW